MDNLKQNGKMKLTEKLTGVAVYNFGIPAFRSVTGLTTCPNAKDCISGCYAKSGSYLYPNTKNAYEQRLEFTQTDSFVPLMSAEIHYLSMKKPNLTIRIHDSGDFYSEEYALKWFQIMRFNPSVKFYAYTKMVGMMKRLRLFGLPENFTLIFSYGGKEDHLINPAVDRHARVFEDEVSLKAAGYADGSDDDMVAARGDSNLIGLVYHGAKNYENTRWGMVAV